MRIDEKTDTICPSQTLSCAVTDTATRLRVLCEVNEAVRRVQSYGSCDITMDTSLRHDLHADLVAVAELVDDVEERLGVRLARLAPQEVDRVGDLVDKLCGAFRRQS